MNNTEKDEPMRSSFSVLFCCKELQHCVPEKLHATLVEIHTSQKIGHHAPSLVQTTEWIAQESSTSWYNHSLRTLL